MQTYQGIVAFCCRKGGVGKTTMLLCVAEALARQDLKVLVVELDNQRNCANYMMRAADSHREWLEAQGEKDPAEKKPRRTAKPVSHMACTGNWRETVAKIADQFDVVLIDTAGYQDAGSAAEARIQEAIEVSDVVVIPMRACQADLDSATATLALAVQHRTFKNPNLAIRALINQDSTTSLADEILEALAGANVQPFNTRIRFRPKAYPGMHSTGIDPATLDTKVRHEVDALALEIISPLEQPSIAVGA